MRKELKLGKKAHVEDPRDLKLGAYLDTEKLPTPPETYTFADHVADGEWGMLLNDKLGSCAPAGVLHTQLVLGRVGEHHPEFNDACCELAYGEMGGYNPADPSTDQGCDMREVAKVWQKSGVPDVNGRRHRCGFYLWLESGNVVELKLATYLFAHGDLGYELPQSALDAYWAAEDQGTTPVWSYDPSSPIVGGHAVPEFGPSEEGVFDGVSWGEKVSIEDAFIENHMDSGFVAVSASVLGADHEFEGLDKERLKADLKELGLEYPAA